jgi:predicted transcriptional regulator of viral defense system
MLHGASHQKYHVFHVVLNRQFHNISKPGLKIVFLHKRQIAESICQKIKVPTGYFRVSTPEATAYDLILYRRACGSLNSVATILVELGEAIRSRKLAALLESGCEISALQRLGLMLDETGWSEKTASLKRALRSVRTYWEPLDTRVAGKGRRNEKWKVIVNMEIEPDITREG